ncbi:MAG: hypothetical protein NT124_02410 [Candidatus Dependentiae bacterium]|nr:hypothetical protein [Candidatus Dependentiae bacterium]
MKKLLLFAVVSTFGLGCVIISHTAAGRRSLSSNHRLHCQAEDFFKEVVGMSESSFRATFGWNEKKGYLAKVPTGSRKSFEDWKRRFIAEFPRRQAIFEGQWRCETLGQLNARIQAQGGVRSLGGRGQLNILLHNDPRGGECTEITALQADPRNNGAVFQLASTFFGPLEGGMENPTASLTGMLHAPVQGEWASISAAGATIYRKYFMPTENFIRRHSEGKKDPSYFYLLHDLGKKALQDKKSGRQPKVDLKALKGYIYNPADAQRVSIFTHANIVTTSSCIKGQDKKTGALLQSIPLGTHQRITQVLNSAYNLIHYYRELKPGQRPQDNVMNFAKMVLGAMYEGTLKSAYLLGKKKVYLTLLGGGAFVNDISWIAEFFERPDIIEFIKNSGLEVSIVYRPDKVREKMVRSAQGDINFLRRMYAVSGHIGGTKRDVMATPHMQQYASYIKQSYAQLGGGGSAVAAPRVSRQQAPAGSRKTTLALSCKPIRGAKKPYHLGWLYSPEHRDFVLVNYGKEVSPVLNRDGSKSFMYVSPSAPTVALPKGLYYWRGSNQVRIPEQLSDRRVVVMVAPTPTTQKTFKFSNGKYENLFKGKKTVWDPAQFQEPTIDQKILRSNR